MLMLRMPRAGRGFTLIELVVTMAVLAILAVITIPSLASWMSNSRIRTAADSIQDGLRQAQAEAVKQNRVVAFFLTTTQPTPSALPAPAAAGAAVNYWYAATVPWTTAALSSSAGSVVVNSNVKTMVANGTVPNANLVNITEPSGTIQTLCFSPYGRLTGTSNDPSASPVTCNLPTNGATTVTYYVTPAATVSNSHQLNVTVSLGGQVRMCDPSVLVSMNAPNGC